MLVGTAVRAKANSVSSVNYDVCCSVVFGILVGASVPSVVLYVRGI